MLVVGCGLIAFGPSLMLWLFVIGRRPVLVIIGIVRYSHRSGETAATSELYYTEILIPCAPSAGESFEIHLRYLKNPVQVYKEQTATNFGCYI